MALSAQTLYIQVAGFVIRLVFEPTESVFFKRKFLKGVQEIWGKGGFLRATTKKADFEIRFVRDASQIEILQKERGTKHYYLTFQRDFGSRKVSTFYYIGTPALQMLLREILAFLVSKDGFLLHASSCLDESGNLFVFLAPSGGGKTTVADLLSKLSGFVKFSDDMLIVRKVRNKWVFFSPPFVEKDDLPTKRKTEAAKIFFVRKSNSASEEKISDKRKILKLVLKQLWLRSGEIERKTLSTAISFASENDFYMLKSSLSTEEMQRVLDEN